MVHHTCLSVRPNVLGNHSKSFNGCNDSFQTSDASRHALASGGDSLVETFVFSDLRWLKLFLSKYLAEILPLPNFVQERVFGKKAVLSFCGCWHSTVAATQALLTVT